MSFKTVIGNQVLVQNWKTAFTQGRLHPVQLLCGAKGSEALHLAIQFAKFLLCEQCNAPQKSLFGDASQSDKKNTEDSCGQCGACKRVDELAHPDLHFFYPVINNTKEGLKLAKDYWQHWKDFVLAHPYGNIFDWINHMDDNNKQANISTEECKWFISTLHKKPYEGVSKVVVFWLPEFLGKDANRLLKILEEPMDNTYLFFVTEDTHLLPSTFKSRFLSLGITLPSDDEISTYLQQCHADREAQHAFIINYCKGNLRLMHNILHDTMESEEEILEQIDAFFNALLVDGPLTQVRWVETMATKSRGFVEYYFSFFQYIVHTICEAQFDSSKMQSIHSERINNILYKIQPYNIDLRSDLVEETISKSIYAVRRNANLKIELHDFLIRMYTIFKANKIFYPVYE